MTTKADTIITVNTGSSSIKVVVFMRKQETVEISPLVNISLSNIGQPMSTLQITQTSRPSQIGEIHVANRTAASHIIIESLTHFVSPNSISAISHRLVHGGTKYIGPTLTTNISEADWELLALLDPEHTPEAHRLITQFGELYPSVPQVACFDTAFFHHLPSLVKRTSLPQKYYEIGVQRYGFHGLSYTSLLKTFRDKAGEVALNGRIVLAHLGSGASVAAMRLGRPIDTTMGLTPASGIIMSSRSGDLDPNTFHFLHSQDGMDLEKFYHMVNFESGLLGISGLSGDMQTLLNVEDRNENASAAIELFVRDIKKSIGAYSALLGGIDSLIFSGGIGEQSSVLRERICQDLEYMGIEIDTSANKEHSFLISSQSSKVGVHVIPTDEARVIATQTIELLHEGLK